MAKHCRGGEVIALCGELGAGKTTLIKGVAEGLGVRPEEVHSPTFVLMNVYEGRLPLYHFDFYRLDRTDEIVRLDYEEYLGGDGVAVIEWADRMRDLLPSDHLQVDMEHRGEQSRAWRVSAGGPSSGKFCARIRS